MTDTTRSLAVAVIADRTSCVSNSNLKKKKIERKN